MTYAEIIAEVSRTTGYSKRLVNMTYRAYWRAVRDYITSLPLKEDLTEDEFLALRPNVNIPSIGKLYVSLDRYKRLKKQGQILKERSYGVTHQEDQAPE